MTKTAPNVKIAERTLGVFEAFARLRKPASLSEISEALDIPVSSCFGLLRTIEAKGYLQSLRPRGGYYPTRRMLNLVTIIAEHDPIGQRLEDKLVALRDETGETVVVGRLRDAEVLYVDVRESPASIRYSAEVGETRSLHANSIGKALLAEMTDAARASLIASLPLTHLTEATLTTPEALEADIAFSKQRGWFLNVAESSREVSAIACSILLEGQTLGLSVVGPRERILANLNDLAAALLRTRDQIIA